MINTTAKGLPISEADIQRFERRRDVNLPNDYKSFLLLTNGGRPERDLFFIHDSKASPAARINFFLSMGDPGDAYDIDKALDTLAGRIEKRFVPIAVTWRGDYVCLEVSGRCAGRVLFWDGHVLEGDSVHLVATSFAQFVESLFRDEHSPKLNKVN